MIRPCNSRVVLLRALVPYLAAWSLLVGVAGAVSPVLSSFSPVGARRGGEVTVTIGGQRLNDFQSLLAYYPGITLKSHEIVNDGQVKVVLAIAPDCRLGNHAFRVVTATGLSNLQVFSVGSLEEIEEKEPNSEFDKPQEIPLDVTVQGSVAVEDIDYYAVEAKKGDRLTAEIEGIRLGKAFFDPYVAIMNPQRFELAGSDSDALLWHDSVASIVVPEDGRYIIAVREASFAVAGQYRLHVGKFPRPLGVIPSGGKPGEKIELTWLGDAGGEFKQSITLPTDRQRYSWIFEPDQSYTAVFPQDARGIAPSPQVFRLSPLDNFIEKEPNEDAATATPFTAPGAVHGVLSTPTDVDLFKFTAKRGEVFEVNVYARSVGSPLDSVLTIRRASNNAVVGTNDDSGRPDSYLRFNAPADDDYLIQVTDLLKKSGPSYAYRVELTPVAPKLVLSLPERVQYVDNTTTIPRGNRMAFMVNAQRRDFNSDVLLSMPNLPKGVTFETVPMAANQSTVPVVMTAAADAPLEAFLADIVGRSADPAISVEGHLRQDTMLVRGQNNSSVFSHTAEFMATNVGEKVPYTVEIIEPKVPLVRNGSMELKVKATRDPEFKAPIAIKLLYNPPGVSSSGAATIPEGQTEGTISLTANANAEIREWKIAVIGESNPGAGNVMISSGFAKLDVADAFFQFAFKPGAAEQGQTGNLVVSVTQNKEFPGQAQVELLGLPAESKAEPVEFNKDAEEFVFTIQTSEKTPAGKHKSLNLKAVVMLNGEPITHTIGPTEFRVDTPLPPKPAVAQKPAPAPAATPAKPPAAVAQTQPAKPLSRLEMLRKQREAEQAAGQQKQEQK